MDRFKRQEVLEVIKRIPGAFAIGSLYKLYINLGCGAYITKDEQVVCAALLRNSELFICDSVIAEVNNKISKLTEQYEESMKMTHSLDMQIIRLSLEISERSQAIALTLGIN